MYRTKLDEFFNNPNWKFSVGWEPYLKRMNVILNENSDTNYPPYDIIKVDEDRIRLDIGLIGFQKSELTIQVSENPDVLRVRGQKKKEENKEQEFLQQGISRRNFKLSFSLIDGLEVEDSKFQNAILSILLRKDSKAGIKNIEIK